MNLQEALQRNRAAFAALAEGTHTPAPTETTAMPVRQAEEFRPPAAPRRLQADTLPAMQEQASLRGETAFSLDRPPPGLRGEESPAARLPVPDTAIDYPTHHIESTAAPSAAGAVDVVEGLEQALAREARLRPQNMREE